MQSHVIRASKRAYKLIKTYIDSEKPTIPMALDKALDVHGHCVKGWALPSQLYRTKKEAREAALSAAARQGLDLPDVETPVRMREY